MDPSSAERDFRHLVDDYRHRCLWFLDEHYYPETAAERERILGLIARHGDQQAFQRVAALRSWLSRSSSETSAAS